MKHRIAKLAGSLLLGLVVLAGTILPVSAQDPTPIVPLTDPMAAFLESRAFAASKGATAEFNKMEWVAIDSVNNKVYVAMTDITKAMSDGEGALKLEENRCGIVYEGDLDKDNNVSALKPLIVGGPYNKDDKLNRCSVDSIASPDSVFVDAAGNLWIGEDTSNHANNVLWRYNLKSKKLERFALVPAGAEVTGFYVTPAGDVFFNAQHPSGMNPYPYNRGFIGVVNGFNATDTFTPLPAPTGVIREVMVAKGEYQMLGRAGELIPNDIKGMRFGELLNYAGSTMGMCNQPDGNMFLPTTEASDEGYLYTNFECRPGGMSKLYVKKDAGMWTILEGENVDFAAVKGTWVNCGSSVSPWNTGLSGEEYEPMAFTDSYKENVKEMTAYLGKQANPYDYGYIVEVKPSEDGETLESVVEKRYALGRFSHEMAAIAKDNKTVYFGDDGANVVFFKFIAEEAGDLSAGTLYAAAVTQNADNSLGLKWIELGKGDDESIAEAIANIKLP